MKRNWLVALMVVLVSSCGDSAEKTETETKDTAAVQTPVEYQHVISSAYMGVLPCTGCEGLETQVTLYADTTYLYVVNYLTKNMEDSVGKNIMKNGKFMMHNDTLHLEGVDNRFIQKDSVLIQLGEKGVKGELKKIEHIRTTR